MKRLYPDKVFDRPEQMEFISLHLTEVANGVVDEVIVVEEVSEKAPQPSRELPQKPS
jgi:hypothetical protein